MKSKRYRVRCPKCGVKVDVSPVEEGESILNALGRPSSFGEFGEAFLRGWLISNALSLLSYCVECGRAEEKVLQEQYRQRSPAAST